jgi:hypothetical protein
VFENVVILKRALKIPESEEKKGEDGAPQPKEIIPDKLLTDEEKKKKEDDAKEKEEQEKKAQDDAAYEEAVARSKQERCVDPHPPRAATCPHPTNPLLPVRTGSARVCG